MPRLMYFSNPFWYDVYFKIEFTYFLHNKMRAIVKYDRNFVI